MQKNTNRILSMLLALVMVLSMLPANVFATSETDALEGWNITLGDNIGVNFYLNSADYTVAATVNGETVTPTISNKVVTVNVAAAQMNDPIVLTVKSGEEVVHTGEYSVRQYADTILNGQYAEYVKDMVKEMLNYGAAAQTYFAHNTDNLANSGITVAAATVPTEVPEVTVTDNLDGISLYGMSLVFRNKTAVRFYFTVSGDISTYTFKVGETVYNSVEKNGLYYIEIDSINPQDIDKDITVSVNDGAMTVTYSPLNYIVRKYNNESSSAELKALVQALYGYHLEALEYIAPPIADVVDLVSHSNGWSSTSAENPGGLTFTAPENDAPYNTDWSLRYTPVSSDAIKLIRDGVEANIANTGAETIIKYSATEYYLEFWPFSQKPMLAGDEIIIDGLFYNKANDTYIDVEKTYLVCNADNTVTVIKDGYIHAGPLTEHSNGIYSEGIYATMAENDAPYSTDWSIEYTPVTADAYYVIRGDEQINIGIPGRGTLVKYSATEYALKINAWCTDNFAYTTDDIIVIDGFWKQNSGGNAIMKIEKTYLYYDGSAWTFSTTEPILPTVVSGGLMQSHSNSHADNGIYFAMDANAAPYKTDWTLEYTQTSVDNIKLIRDGETISIGIVDRPLIIKYSETDYYLKLEGWNVGDYAMNGTTSPITTDDVIVIEGDFEYAAQNVTLNITKSYVYYDGSAWVCSAILPTTVAGGVMVEVDGYGWTGGTGNLIFKMDNAAPTGGYAPTSASNVKLIRDGATYDVGYVGQDVINKHNDGWYTLEFWTIVDYKPMLANDILVVEGDFYQSSTKTTLNISKTYVLLNADGSAEFSTEMPIIPTTVAGGMLNEVSGYGWTGGTGNLIFKMDNAAPTGGYAPTSASNVKLIRDGATYDVGYVGQDVINKYNDGWYTLEFWTIVDYKPMLANDILVVEGDFYQSSTKTTLNISKTYVLLNADGSAEFSAEMPSLATVIDGGLMQTHSNGMSGNGIYFTMDANDAPYNTDWSMEYTQTSVDNIKLIRDGETISIGIVGRPLIIKYGTTDYYLKLEGWNVGDYGINGQSKAITTDDIIIIEGGFGYTAENVTLNITKSYVYYDGSAWVCSAVEPVRVQAGHMITHSNGMSGNGIYFTMADNNAPYNTDWSLEYTQTSADNIKLIRDGETISIGIVGRPLIIKYGAIDYYLKLEGWNVGDYGVNGQSKAITTDDIIIVEGTFEYAAANAKMTISKSYVYYDGSAWVCSAEAPAQKNIVDLVDLDSHAVNGWTSNGFYFVAPENDAPFNTDWSLRYTPVSADVIKLVHDGVTTNKGNTGGETIIKYSATEYYIEGWAVGMSSVVAGDVMIIEGQFYNAANDTYVEVEKTYFTFNADGTVSVISESDKYINAGAMSASETGWMNNGFYFNMTSNGLPYNAAQEDWSIEYAPTSTAAIKLIRDGVTTDSARVGAGTMIKLTDGKYYMKIEGWTITSISSKDDLQVGDILVVEGDFVSESNGYTLHIDESYITIGEGSVSFSTAADTEFGEVLLPNSADTLNIGVWNGSYHVFEDKQLQELQAAGITKIVGIDTQWIDTTDVNAWLDRVYSYGIRVVFDLRTWDGETVPSYASHPGVLGFLMYDEPSTTNFDALAELKAKYDAIDAFDGKIFYVNLLASCVADSSLFGENYNSSQTDYDQYYVTEFLNKLDIQVLSWDNYSLISQADDTSAKGIRTDYFYNFEVMANKAKEKNLPLWYIMLSAGHTSGAENTIYNTPTAAELRWQMAVAMTYGVKNIDHFVYVSHESDFSSMVEYNTWEPTDLYYDILTVDNEYLAWDNIFMAYDWVGVGKYSANSKDTMLDQLENCLTLSDYGIASVSADQNLLVGVFDHNGDKAYMVTNAGSTSTSWFGGDVGDGREFNMADSTVTLTLDAADYKCVAIIDQGVITHVAVNADNTVSIPVSAYEGVFVIPVLN